VVRISVLDRARKLPLQGYQRIKSWLPNEAPSVVESRVEPKHDRIAPRDRSPLSALRVVPQQYLSVRVGNRTFLALKFQGISAVLGTMTGNNNLVSYLEGVLVIAASA
jgi:hypothetical protein